MIPYTGHPNAADVPTLNTQLAAMAATKSTAQSPVVMADQYTGFTVSQDTFDNVHPNATGEEKMAAKWMAAIPPYLVGPPLAIDTPTVPDATQHTAFSTVLQASGGKPPYSWMLVPGFSLPGDLILEPEGLLVGTPQVAGDFTFNVKVTDALSATAIKTFSLHVATPLENWRLLHFQSAANAGDASNQFDFDKDGLVNLVEYAFGLDPKNPGSAQIPQPLLSGGQLSINYTRPPGFSGITHGAEWTAELDGTWAPISSTATAPDYHFSVPIEGQGKLFIRHVISAP